MDSSTKGWADKRRGSRHERGYGYAWDKLRLQILKRDSHLCQCPQCMGGEVRVMVATQVDHIKPKAQGGDDSPDNLRAVSAECHRRITLEQQGKKPKPRVEIGVDGYPLPGQDHPWSSKP